MRKKEGTQPVRVFLGIFPRAQSIRQLAPFRNTLVRRGYRLVPLGNIHCTLLFFGTIRYQFLHEIASIVQRHTKDIRAFPLTFAQDWRIFHKGARSAVALMAKRTRTLMTLQKKLTTAFRNNAYSLERRAFLPHMTIARGKGSGMPATARRQQSTSSFLVQSISIVVSVHEGGRQKYRIWKNVFLRSQS
jgi:2'-5' RNA ligase